MRLLLCSPLDCDWRGQQREELGVYCDPHRLESVKAKNTVTNEPRSSVSESDSAGLHQWEVCSVGYLICCEKKREKIRLAAGELRAQRAGHGSLGLTPLNVISLFCCATHACVSCVINHVIHVSCMCGSDVWRSGKIKAVFSDDKTRPKKKTICGFSDEWWCTLNWINPSPPQHSSNHMLAWTKQKFLFLYFIFYFFTFNHSFLDVLFFISHFTQRDMISSTAPFLKLAIVNFHV